MSNFQNGNSSKSNKLNKSWTVRDEKETPTQNTKESGSWNRMVTSIPSATPLSPVAAEISCLPLGGGGKSLIWPIFILLSKTIDCYHWVMSPLDTWWKLKFPHVEKPLDVTAQHLRNVCCFIYLFIHYKYRAQWHTALVQYVNKKTKLSKSYLAVSNHMKLPHLIMVNDF